MRNNIARLVTEGICGARVSALGFDLGQCAEDLPQLPTRSQRFRFDTPLLQALTRGFNLPERSLRPRQNQKCLWNEQMHTERAQPVEKRWRQIEDTSVIILRDGEVEFPVRYI